MKYCHNCGAPLVDDVRFCTACGSPLDPPETEPAMSESAVMPEMPEPAPEMPVMPGEALPPEPPKKRKKRIWLWILLPVVVLALAAGALYYFLVWNAPEARVQRAWQKTAAALETEVGRPEKLMAFAETLRGPLSEQRALTADLQGARTAGELVYRYDREIITKTSSSAWWDEQGRLQMSVLWVESEAENRYMFTFDGDEVRVDKWFTFGTFKGLEKDECVYRRA